MDSDFSIADDRLLGAQAIADFRGEPIRRTRWLIESGQIPFGREGHMIVASKRALLEDYQQKTTGKAA